MKYGEKAHATACGDAERPLIESTKESRRCSSGVFSLHTSLLCGYSTQSLENVVIYVGWRFCSYYGAA